MTARTDRTDFDRARYEEQQARNAHRAAIRHADRVAVTVLREALRRDPAASDAQLAQYLGVTHGPWMQTILTKARAWDATGQDPYSDEPT